jgi:hypothetical protein
LDVLLELIRVILNAAVQAERSEHLRAAPYQHTQERRGYANDFKPKTMRTRVGEITFAVPQVREGGFYKKSGQKKSCPDHFTSFLWALTPSSLQTFSSVAFLPLPLASSPQLSLWVLPFSQVLSPSGRRLSFFPLVPHKPLHRHFSSLA